MSVAPSAPRKLEAIITTQFADFFPCGAAAGR